MREFGMMLAVSAVLIAANGLRADEIPAKSKITSVGLFKNGLAVVKREVTVPGAGTYRLDDSLEPVHGTYWVEGEVPVETMVQMREVDVPVEPTGANLQEELAGKKVTINFRGAKLPPLTGIVIPPPKKKPEEIHHMVREYDYRPPMPEAASRFLILKTTTGRAYVDPSDIAYYEAEGTAETVKRRKPVLLLTVDAAVKQPTTFTVSYLAHGLSWAPSYRVDISDPKRLTLEQSAVVKNEMAELKDADIHLISGFPSVQFANVISPLSAHTSWAQFFQQITQRVGRTQDMLGNSMGQQAMGDYGRQGPQANIMPGREGIDLYYHAIGKRSLAVGDSLALTTTKGQADYEHIVEWLIPDTRNEFGRHLDRNQPSQDDDSADDAWDALKFKNPFTFPMTTGAAMVLANGRFSGQRQTNWVNAGEETTLRVNKALSVRTRSVEFEEQKAAGVSEREIIHIGGRRFRQASVQGELKLCNHRADPINMLIRRRFSGDLTKADGEPKVQLREEGVYAVNKRNELVWNFTLKPSEEKTLAYQYKVLVEF